MEKRKYVEKRKLSGGKKMFRKWESWKEGEYVIGKLVGTHLDQYKKLCPLIEVETAEFEEGASFEGNVLVLNSCGMLDKAISKVVEGAILQVTYQGSSLIERGPYKGKVAHKVEVLELEEEGSLNGGGASMEPNYFIDEIKDSDDDFTL